MSDTYCFGCGKQTELISDPKPPKCRKCWSNDIFQGDRKGFLERLSQRGWSEENKDLSVNLVARHLRSDFN